jgi:hypothetical protein
VCSECRRAGLDTAEGRVEVSGAVIGRIEGDARKEEIALAEEGAEGGRGAVVESGVGPGAEHGRVAGRDSPETRPEEGLDRATPPALRRRILLRDGARCANPSCRAAAEHCHHIVFRSRGGRSALRNETSVCGRCHALIHAGLLTVAGDPAVGLRWRARGEDLELGPAAGEGGSEEGAAPPPRWMAPPGGPATPWSPAGSPAGNPEPASPAAESGRADSAVGRTERPAPDERASARCDDRAVSSGVLSGVSSGVRSGVESGAASGEESGRADSALAGNARPPIPRSESERADSVSGRRIRILVRGLVRLGEGAVEARERIEGAIARLADLGVEPTDQNILQETLCPGAAKWRAESCRVRYGPPGQGRNTPSSMNTGVSRARTVCTM